MNTPFVFFGTSRFSVILLEELKTKHGIIPSLIVTTPDRPVGRKQIMTGSPVKEWALSHDLEILQPEKLKDTEFQSHLTPYSLFIVASYGKIIPQSILDIPSHGTLNVHPSLLPKYRGASPLQSQILNDEKHVGTTIMLMDAEMDHGNIITQKEIALNEKEFPTTYTTFEERLALESSTLLAEILPQWISGSLSSVPQNHEAATYTTMIEKTDGEIHLEDDGYKNYLKYLAYDEWPKTFFFTEKDGVKTRNKITEAAFENGKFVVKKIIPEGKNETHHQSM